MTDLTPRDIVNNPYAGESQGSLLSTFLNANDLSPRQFALMCRAGGQRIERARLTKIIDGRANATGDEVVLISAGIRACNERRKTRGATV